MFDWVHPADGDQVTGRHHAARTADRPVLQDSTERPRRGARRTRLSVPFPGKRAPTIQLCRDPQGYIPVGSNPWRGPPVPYGTPVEDPRMTLPMNKFPFIPPQVDPDPGPPVVQLPPGVAQDRGRRRRRSRCRWRRTITAAAAVALLRATGSGGAALRQACAGCTSGAARAAGRRRATATAEAPAAWSHHPPEGQGDGPAMATYDQNGKFVDPAGGTGVFAAGADKLAPAEFG